MKDFYISAKISVDDSQDIQEFKRLEHHAEFLFDLESYPEIKEVFTTLQSIVKSLLQLKRLKVLLKMLVQSLSMILRGL